MYKPAIFCPWAQWNFCEFNKKVSISVDTVNLNDNAEFKVFVQIEPPSVSAAMQSVIANYRHYDLILAWHPDLLKMPNSVLFPFGTRWINDANVSIKSNEVSFLTSSKNFCPGHHFRHQVFSWLPDQINGMKINKYMSPPRIERKADMLESYKYSIIIENESVENWFTEKLIDCIVCKTIPLYNGCPNIGNFFNNDGILTFNSLTELEAILHRISNTDVYSTKLSAVNDNFKRADQYGTLWERVETEIRKRA